MSSGNNCFLKLFMCCFFMSSYFHVWSLLSSFFFFCFFCGILFALFVSSGLGFVRVWIWAFGDFWVWGFFSVATKILRRFHVIIFKRKALCEVLCFLEKTQRHNVKSSRTCRMNSNMLRIVFFWCNRCMELRTRQRCGKTTASA